MACVVCKTIISEFDSRLRLHLKPCKPKGSSAKRKLGKGAENAEKRAKTHPETESNRKVDFP